MNICLIGDFSEQLDEGYKNTSHHLASILSTSNHVTRINAKRLGSRDFWRCLIKARPQIIHTISQPTLGSLFFTHLLSFRWHGARTVVSALKAEAFFVNERPTIIQSVMVRATRPNLMCVQSVRSEIAFRSLGCTTCQVPNGVDLNHFAPATMAEKRKLRIKYGLDVDQPVVLHVGHLEPDRNLTALTALPSAGMQVVVAGSLYMGIHEELITRLESAGLIILRGFQPHVEELYKLADCYIFPLPPGNSITMPLSVLEAMACNLPVITTRFSGLVQAFAQGNGIRYLESEENVLEVVHEVLRSGMPVLTRDLVIPYSWPAIAARLQAHYERLLNQ